MNKKQAVFKFIFSVVFIATAVLKLSSEQFNDKIDITFISLILISFLPWLSGYLKSLEAFGVKAEFISEEKKEKIDKEAKEVIKSNKTIIKNSIYRKNNKEITKYKNEIEEIHDKIDSINDPMGKMTLIRHEIEKRLRNIWNLCIDNAKYRGIASMTDELYKREIISSEVHNLIFDLMPALNKAVHADISIKEYDNLMWVIDKGMTIIDYLYTKSIEIKLADKHYFIFKDEE